MIFLRRYRKYTTRYLHGFSNKDVMFLRKTAVNSITIYKTKYKSLKSFRITTIYLYRHYSDRYASQYGITYDHSFKRYNKISRKIKEFDLTYRQTHYNKYHQVMVNDSITKKELRIVNLIKRRVANKRLDNFIQRHFKYPNCFKTQIYINGELRETLPASE